MKLLLVVLSLGLTGCTYRESSQYWEIREQAYADAVRDVQAYHQCFIYPEREDDSGRSARLRGGNWPPEKYMREAAHFTRESLRDCYFVVAVNNSAAVRKP